MKNKVKVKEHEKLGDTNIQHVIALLEKPQPITKKAACEILNISYNTTRLSKIIEEFKERKLYEASRREKNRGKPAELHEIKDVIELYLSGENVSAIAKHLFRSTAFVDAIIEKVGIPVRPTGDLRFVKALLPEACVASEFSVGEIAWSAKYHRPCEIKQELTQEFIKNNVGFYDNATEAYQYPCYRIYVLEKIEEDVPLRFANISMGGHYAYAYSYDLGKLEHLKQYGINLEKL